MPLSSPRHSAVDQFFGEPSSQSYLRHFADRQCHFLVKRKKSSRNLMIMAVSWCKIRKKYEWPTTRMIQCWIQRSSKIPSELVIFVSRACENVYLASNQFEDLSAFKGRCPIFAWLQSCQTLRRPVSFERQKRDVIKSAPHPTFCHLVVSVSIVLKCADRFFSQYGNQLFIRAFNSGWDIQTETSQHCAYFSLQSSSAQYLLLAAAASRLVYHKSQLLVSH